MLQSVKFLIQITKTAQSAKLDAKDSWVGVLQSEVLHNTLVLTLMEEEKVEVVSVCRPLSHLGVKRLWVSALAQLENILTN